MVLEVMTAQDARLTLGDPCTFAQLIARIFVKRPVNVAGVALTSVCNSPLPTLWLLVLPFRGDDRTVGPRDSHLPKAVLAVLLGEECSAKTACQVCCIHAAAYEWSVTACYMQLHG